MYLFTRRAVRKIQRDHERLAYAPVAPVAAVPNRRLAPAGPVAQMYVAKTTSTITAMSDDAPGSGTAKLAKLKSDGDLDAFSDGDLVVNNIGGAVDSSTYCLVSQDTFGSWWLVVVPCE